MFEIDWSAARPTAAAFDEAWPDTRITALATVPPAIVEVEHALISARDLGGARVAQFRIEASGPVAWAIARNQLHEFGFFDHFFACPTVLTAVPEAADARSQVAAFDMGEVFTSFGRLAGIVAGGGAYQRFADPGIEVWEIVGRFMQAALGPNIRSALSWTNWQAWSPWFCDVAWDATFFWFDCRTGIATVLVTTDTD